MAVFVKMTAIILFICVVAIFAKNLEEFRSNDEDGNVETAEVHHFVKRSLGYQDGDDSIFQPAYENAFDRPHRIRALPGFLH